MEKAADQVGLRESCPCERSRSLLGKSHRPARSRTDEQGDGSKGIKSMAGSERKAA